jgi:hypothetical protein
LDRQPVHFRGGLPSGDLLVDVQMGEQCDPAFDHGEGLGDDDGAPPQGRGPMTLLSVVALQSDGLALTLVVAADRQHQWVDDEAVGAKQAHLPAREALEQTPEGPFIAVTAFPVHQTAGAPVVGFPNPDLVRLRV